MTGRRKEPWKPRFFAKVSVPDANGCLVWTGAVHRLGHGSYGRFKIGDHVRYAHRVAYEWWNGPIPEGLVIHHRCRNTLCVAPEHLVAVTDRENVVGDPESRSLAAVRSQVTHCPRGHEYTEESTYWSKKRQRTCRVCVREVYGPRQRAKQRGD